METSDTQRPKPSTVGAVIAAYHPDPAMLEMNVRRLAPQVSAILIVDNTPTSEPAGVSGIDSLCSVVRFGANRGVATAHNAGIRWAQDHGFDYLLILDQDSEPAINMVERLRVAADDLVSRGVQLAAVGARYHDPRSGRASDAIQLTQFGVRHVDCPANMPRESVQTDVLISSGMMVQLATIERVGVFEESLFVDQVDHEWSLRARQAGFHCYMICNAELFHRLGDSSFRYWLGRWRHVPVHPPERHYFMFRNTLLLARRRYVPLAWTLAELRKLLAVVAVTLLFVPGRFRRLMSIRRAIVDGLSHSRTTSAKG